MKALDGDIICMQEVEEDIFDCLSAGLPALEGWYQQKSGGKRDAQIGPAHVDMGEPPAGQYARQPAAHGFHFGEFRHGVGSSVRRGVCCGTVS